MKIHPHRIRLFDIVATFRRLWNGISFNKIFQECYTYAVPPSNWQTELNYYLCFERVCSLNVPLVLTWFRHFRVNRFELEISLKICISNEIEAGIFFLAAITMLGKRASIQAVNFICSMQKFTLSMWINTIWISYEMDQRPIFNSLE